MSGLATVLHSARRPAPARQSGLSNTAARLAIARTSVLLIGAIALSGCVAETKLGSGSDAVRVAQSLPAPDSAAPAVDLAPYRIGPGDEIAISVFGAPELDKTAIVDAAGGFALPLAGTVTAGGKTPEELSKAIEEKLRGGYLKNPKVAVNVTKAGNFQTVTVDGEVAQPGLYPVVSRMTLQQAIATAHGATDTANIRNVIVFRTVEGQKMAAMFDLKAIRSGRSQDPQIFGNDIVVVGESAIQKFLQNSAIAITSIGRFIPIL
jgi:polysaccharide export outer membrane protein